MKKTLRASAGNCAVLAPTALLVLVATMLLLVACNSSSSVGQSTSKEELGLPMGAHINNWTDPTTGCIYYVYREGFGNDAVGSLSIKYRKDGQPDCGHLAATTAPVVADEGTHK